VAEFVGTMNRIPGVVEEGRVSLLGSMADIRTVAGQPADRRPSGTLVDVLVRPEGLAVTPSPQGRGLVMTTTFLGSVTRLGVLLDEDVMVYVDQPNSAAQVPVGTAAEVTLTERAVMVSDRTSTGTAQVAEGAEVAGVAEASEASA
jgi:putative spermidine/putrescine transport system ATP-binding protein